MGRKMVIFFIVFLILLIAVGGFFCWQKSKNESKFPTLFDKDDYKIIEKNGEKFIEVEKVGLSAKVPKDWSIKYEGNDIPEPGYWVELYSPNFETSSENILNKGCLLSISALTSKETVQAIKENIKILQEHPEKIDQIKRDYMLAEDIEILEFGNYVSLKITSQENPILGQGINIDIPIENNKWITINFGFPLKSKEECTSVWEEFIKNISIK